MDRLSERFLSAGFHSSGAIPAQWIPHLHWALLLWGLQGREMLCLGGTAGGRWRAFGSHGGPQPLQKGHSYFSPSISALGLVHF